MVFVRGPEHSNIQHFVEKVVFHLHESFPKPKRVCKDPPYKVEESGYAGFILPIEVYFKNKEEPKKVRFDYDLFLHLEGHPPVNHLRCEKLTFNNPTEEFRRKLLKAGGQRDPHKRSTDDSKDVSKGSCTTLLTTATTTSTDNTSFSKLHKPSSDHKDKPPKDLKESKSAFRDSGWEPSKSSRDPSKKPKENQPLRDINPKMGFKEPKSLSKDHRTEGMNHNSGLKKSLSTPEGDDYLTKKRKKRSVDSSGKQTSGLDAQHSDKNHLKDRSQMRTSKLRSERDDADCRRASTLPPMQEPVDLNYSDVEDQSVKSDSEQLSPASSSSGSGFAPTHHSRQGLDPLHLPSDNNDEDSDEDDDNDVDSDAERPAHSHLTHQQRRVSLSDGSESDSSSRPSHNEAPPLLKTTNNQILEVKSPTKQVKQDRNKSLDLDKAYLDELVELHKRLMALREGHVLQQIVNLIEETGHFHITNTSFDFDLCSLDRNTVRKLQSYLETSGLS
ncbi:protein AF-9 isoform X2 [Antennarius striatus]